MTYYIHVENDKIISSGECPMGEPFISIEVTEEQYNQCLEYGINYFVYDNGELIVNPNYEEEQAEKERERVGNLQVTKRVFALALQQLGISYSQLKELIASNEQAQLEWDLCVELQRKNPLLDVMAAQLGVSSETLDMIFKRANGEN
ncbi:MAG: hypothetical protein IIW86_03295 [Clostridia bacterium]|nr:hypothetical protein [Clostridia bacterium]